MNYRLLAIDMDHTLLKEDKSISEKNQQVIAKAVNEGIKVVLCSGRSHAAVVDYAKQLGLTGKDNYIITSGGASIDSMDGENIYRKTLSNRFYREFVDFANTNDISYNVLDPDSRAYTDNKWIEPHTAYEAFETGKGLYLKQPDDLPDDFEIMRGIFNGSKEYLDEKSQLIHQQFDEKYFVARTGSGFIEVFPEGVNKGNALEYLANYLDIELDKIMAFGDRDNDVPMFKIAGFSVAMENAVEGPKKISDYITKDNEHDGVGEAIEKFAL